VAAVTRGDSCTSSEKEKSMTNDHVVRTPVQRTHRNPELCEKSINRTRFATRNFAFRDFPIISDSVRIRLSSRIHFQSGVVASSGVPTISIEWSTKLLLASSGALLASSGALSASSGSVLASSGSVLASSGALLASRLRVEHY
jgi:hypothetical protein